MEKNGRTRHIRTDVLNACVLSGLTFLVYSFVLTFPFIHDDWLWLYKFSFSNTTEVLNSILQYSNKLFYRPLGQLYFFGLFKVFGFSSVYYHVLAVLIHVVNGLCVYLVLYGLTRQKFLGWSAAFLYILAASLHFETLSWIVGIYELGAVLLFLVSLLLFMRDRWLLSALCYLGSLLFKESTVLLPFLLASYVFLFKPKAESIAKRLVPVVPHFVILLVYAAIKIQGINTFSLPESHPYTTDFLGIHALFNIMAYLKWTFQAFFPLSIPGMLFFINIAILAVLVGWLGFRRKPRSETITQNIPVVKHLLFYAIWIGICLAPLVPVPNHAYRYYLVILFPAVIGMAQIMLLVFADDLKIDFKAVRITLVVFICLMTVNSISFLNAMKKEGLVQLTLADGSNRMVRRVITVNWLQEIVTSDAADYAEKNNIVFENVSQIAFQRCAGLRTLSANNSINVYDITELGLNTNNPDELVNKRGEQVRFGQEKALPCSSIIYYQQQKDSIVRMPTETLLEKLKEN